MTTEPLIPTTTTRTEVTWWTVLDRGRWGDHWQLHRDEATARSIAAHGGGRLVRREQIVTTVTTTLPTETHPGTTDPAAFERGPK